MSNEGVVKQVSDAIAAAGTKYDAIKFCGFDAGTKQIEWMKKTTGAKLIGAVAQDSYQIGYNAVEQAVFAAEGKTVKLPLRGPVENTARDILGGLRSACKRSESIRLRLIRGFSGNRTPEIRKAVNGNPCKLFHCFAAALRHVLFLRETRKSPARLGQVVINTVRGTMPRHTVTEQQ